MAVAAEVTTNHIILPRQDGDPVVPELSVSREAVLDQYCIVWLPWVSEAVPNVMRSLAVGVPDVGSAAGVGFDGHFSMITCLENGQSHE